MGVKVEVKMDDTFVNNIVAKCISTSTRPLLRGVADKPGNVLTPHLPSSNPQPSLHLIFYLH